MSLEDVLARQKLDSLRTGNTSIFGSDYHGFLLHKPLAEIEVAAFEQEHSIRLPTDYRHFLTKIGNGGAGPDYGVFPLGYSDGLGDKLEQWREGESIVGKLSEQFVHQTAWNDLSGKPQEDLLEQDEAEYWRQLESFEGFYWGNKIMNGAIPICHEGCAQRIWLVVTGQEAGYLWRDKRCDHTGIAPLRLSDGSKATFSGWYSEWLDQIGQ
jgi:hypothetical protein